MSSRSPKLYIEDILQAGQDILEFTKDMVGAKGLENDRVPTWLWFGVWK